MKAYIGSDEEPQEGAVLIFANTAREAKKIGFPFIRSWFDTEWVDMRAILIKDLPEHLKKLDTGEPKVIDNPPSCPTCELWGYHKVDNPDRCQNCESEE